jgi:hypothetical protein
VDESNNDQGSEMNENQILKIARKIIRLKPSIIISATIIYKHDF